MGHPLLREDGSVIYSCCCVSPVQSFWGPSYAGLKTKFYCLNWDCASPLLLSSQSYITTDSQSVSKSWCRAQIGTFDRRFFFLSCCPVICGRPLWREVGSVIYQSLSVQSRVVSQYLRKLFTVCVKHTSYLQYLTLNIYIVLNTFTRNTKKYNVRTIYTGISQFRLCTADYALVTNSLIRQFRHLNSRTHDRRQV
jgi:hypothetical protein